MGFDYVIDYPCEIKRNLGIDANEMIVQINKNFMRYHSMEKLMKHGNPNVNIDDEFITGVVCSSEGTTGQRMQMRDLKKSFESLRPLSQKYCPDCPVNPLRDRADQMKDFGCHGYISYPISAIAEDLIYKTAVNCYQNRRDEESFVFFEIIRDNVDTFGKTWNSYRNDRPGAINENANPHAIKDSDGNLLVYTDQIFELLFPNRKIFRKWIVLLLHFLNELTLYILQNNIDTDTTSKEIMQYFLAMKFAYRNDCDIICNH